MKALTLILSFLSIQVLYAQNWFEVNSTTQSNLRSIDFPSEKVGYIVGDDSLLLKTTDGGRTWQRKALTGVTFHTLERSIRFVTFLDESMGYLIVDTQSPSGLMYKTTDGGNSWVQDIDLNLCLPRKVYFFDEMNAVAVGAGCFSGETIDRLVNGTWQGQQALNSFDPLFDLTAIDFLNPSFGFVAGKSKYIFKTTDGGVNWDTALSTIDTGRISDILILNDSIAYATYPKTGQTGVLITTDGGETWANDGTFATFFYPGFNAIEQSNSGNIFLGGIGPSNKGFLQWQSSIYWPHDGADQRINDLSSYSDSTVFAVGDSGLIVVNKDPILLSVELSVENSEIKIYPNPVKDVLSIESTHQEPSSIVIYELNGRKMYEQNNLLLNKFQINISSWNSGMYVIQIISSNRVTTKKISIIN